MSQLETCHDHAKNIRAEVQKGPVPYMPPTLLLHVMEEPQGVIIAGKTDEVAVSGLLSAIPVLTAVDHVVLTFESYVRPVESTAVGNMAEDPMAQRAVCTIEVYRNGDTGFQVSPYNVNDQGALVWSQPGSLVSPAVGQLTSAVQELFANQDEASHELAHEAMQWLVLNKYNVNVSRTLLGCADDES